MPLGTEVGLGLGLRDTVSLWTQLPLEKRARPPQPTFRPMSIVVTVAHLSYC